MKRHLKKYLKKENQPWLLIVNPQAGGGKSLKLLPKIEKALQKEGVFFSKFIAKSKEEFLGKLKETSKWAGIAIVGGDSAFCMALEKTKGQKIPLSFIPAGSQNDFARHLKLSNYLDIAQVLKKPPLLCDDFYFCANNKKITIAGQVNFGLGAVVNSFVENFKKKHPFYYKLQFFLGLFAIILAVLKKKSPIYMKISAHNFKIAGFFHIALFTKIQYWGGGFHFAPKASLRDGYINLVLVKKCSFFKLLFILTLSYWGKHLFFREVISLKRKIFFIEFKNRTMAQIDGEIWEELSQKYKIFVKKNGYYLQANTA